LLANALLHKGADGVHGDGVGVGDVLDQLALARKRQCHRRGGAVDLLVGQDAAVRLNQAFRHSAGGNQDGFEVAVCCAEGLVVQ
jgi:hypothetical protein